MTSAQAKARTYPVVELFGPTIQGEGPAQGERCWFLRLGGCDYRCEWCDSMHAVEPAQVREAQQLTALEIVGRLYGMGMAWEDLLILSGGNPALHHLGPLIEAALRQGWRLHVETQGTVCRDWLNLCDLVVVSPKPPSAFADGLAGARKGLQRLQPFLQGLDVPWALKLVAFNDADLDWAAMVAMLLRTTQARSPVGMYLSAGTMQGLPPAAMVEAVVERFAWLCNKHVARPELARFKVGLQQHVLAWPGELER